MPRMLIARISVGAAFVFTTIGCGSGGSTAANNGNSAGRDAGVGGDAGSSGGSSSQGGTTNGTGGNTGAVAPSCPRIANCHYRSVTLALTQELERRTTVPIATVGIH